MRTSLFALGIIAVGLVHCSGDKGLFVGAERAGEGGEAGDSTENGGSTSTTGGHGGSGGAATGGGGSENNGGSDRGGSENTGGSDRGGSENTGGSGMGAEGGTDSGGGSGGANAGGMGGGGMGGVAAHAGMGAIGGKNDGGRAGSANAGAGGVSDSDCTAMASEYRERLAVVQQCSPNLTVEQCTLEMPDDLLCGCKTFVNPAREADIRRMQELIEKTRNCSRICAAVTCHMVTRGACSFDAAIVAAPGRCIAQ